MVEFNVNPDDEPTKVHGELPSGEQRIVAYCKHLFRMYAQANALDTEQMESVRIQHFVEWCRLGNNMPVRDRDMQELADSLKILPADIEAVRNNLNNPYSACALLMPLWQWLVLSGRKPVKAPFGFFHVAMTLGFLDKKVVHFAMPTRWNPNSPLTDGFAVSLLKDQCDCLIQKIAHAGIDALYKEHATPYDDSVEMGG